MKKRDHFHIVHQSLILDATISDIKVSWLGYLGLAGMMLFPFTGGNPFGIAGLAAILWAVKSYILQPIYYYDPQAIELFFTSILWQDEFYQSQADIHKQRPENGSAIPNVNL